MRPQFTTTAEYLRFVRKQLGIVSFAVTELCSDHKKKTWLHDCLQKGGGSLDSISSKGGGLTLTPQILRNREQTISFIFASVSKSPRDAFSLARFNSKRRTFARHTSDCCPPQLFASNTDYCFTCVGFLLERCTTSVQGLLATVRPRFADFTPDPHAADRTGVTFERRTFSLAGTASARAKGRIGAYNFVVNSFLNLHCTSTPLVCLIVTGIWYQCFVTHVQNIVPVFFLGVFPYVSMDACPANKFWCMRSNLRADPAVGCRTFVFVFPDNSFEVCDS